MLVVHPSVQANTVEALIVLARSMPGQINYGSFGNGSIVHLGCELLKMTAGIDMTHVVYRGVAQALTDLISGQVQMILITIPSALPHLGTGRIRGLAVTSRQRSQLTPSIPTMIEAGVPDYELTTWFGMFVPSGTPRAIVLKLQGEVARIMNLPDVKIQLDKRGFDVVPANSPEQFTAFLKAETEKFAKVIKTAGVKVE
jgi:tripartite-type tricarboxylate transporter receptor subunit TctC